MPDQDDMIKDIHQNITIIKTVLLGANGDKGLVGKVEKTCEHLEKLEAKTSEQLGELEAKHQKLSGNFKLLAGLLFGSGALGGAGAAASIIKLLG